MLVLAVSFEKEARPLVAHFGLKQQSSYPLIYKGSEMTLIVTGIGQENSLISIAYLFGFLKEPVTMLLNVGIVGHRSFAKGEALVAHKVISAGRAPFYPSLLFSPPCATSDLFTVDAVELSYEREGAYDQEAFFIAEASKRFLGQDRIHFFKIVSDNPSSLPQYLTKLDLFSLIEAKIPLLAECIIRMKRVFSDKTLFTQEWIDLTPYGLTFTERERALKLLRRLSLLNPAALEKTHAKTKDELFHVLENQLNISLLTLPALSKKGLYD